MGILCTCTLHLVWLVTLVGASVISVGILEFIIIENLTYLLSYLTCVMPV
jgi:hypothetical protein